MPTINFLNQTRDAGKVSVYSKKVIEDILKKTGISQITITSTARTAQDQARIMYENIQRHGVSHQKKLYGSSGDKVIDEYSALKSNGKTKPEIINGMKAKITQIGAGKVSKHAADPKKINVVDIAPSSINMALRNKFVVEINKDSRVSKLLMPPSDPAYHLEIPQP